MRVIIAGGGTGGHLFPGIALAQSLNTNHNKITFFCSKKRLDYLELAEHGIDFVNFPASKKIDLSFFKSILKSIYHLIKISPDIVIGTGGYASLPALIGAIVLRIPYVLLEQNLIPGRVNRLMAYLSSRIFCQWLMTQSKFIANHHKVIISGSPIRRSLFQISREVARLKLSLNPERLTITVIGGSQGAVGLNSIVINELGRLADLRDKIQIIHISGFLDYERVKDFYDYCGFKAHVFDFCHDMATIYSASDFVISRAGALTLQELSFYGLPSLLIPYPQSAFNHQLANARFLAAQGAALLQNQNQFSAGFLERLVLSYLKAPEVFRQMGDRLKVMFKHDAVRTIPQEIMKLCNHET